MRLMVENGAGPTRVPDAPLVQVIANALFRRTHRAPKNQRRDVAGVTSRGCEPHPAARVSVPANTDAILTGSQPAVLSARKLARADLPLMWNDQSVAFRSGENIPRPERGYWAKLTVGKGLFALLNKCPHRFSLAVLIL